MKLNQYQRAKLNKILIIVAIALVVIAIIATILYISIRNKRIQENKDYADIVVNKHLFNEISINTETKEVERDGKETTLKEEFGIDENLEQLLLSDKEELKKYFENSAFELEVQDNLISLNNKYQTRTIFVETDKKIRDDFDADVITIQDGLYMLKFDSQKRTKAAYESFQFEENIKKVELDEVLIIDPIDDESQTVYGEAEVNDSKNKTTGISAMGINNYKKVINDNGSASDILVATIGYGAVIDHSYFKDKISSEYYNFIDDAKEVHETIPQGSRILEVIKESTTKNIKILPLVVVNDENYSTISSIIQAITFASRQADVICYEIVHKEDYMINLVLGNAFKQNKPVCCVTNKVKDGEKSFPASSSTTIAVSSVDKYLKPATYSGNGDYIDFAASSTDIQEIFNSSTNVSMWSGAEYANAHVVSLIALIKSYNKQATIEEVYKNLRDHCQDLGDKGKDNKYGYGFPNYNSIKISDIDKVVPEFKQENVTLDDSKWEKTKNVQLKATDNIKIFGWNVTKSKDVPKTWNKLEGNNSTLDVKHEIKEKGTYYAWVTDSAGNAAYVNFEVAKIDAEAPKITYTIDTTTKDSEKYVTINASATDTDSGLHETAYSWDKQNWNKDGNSLKVTANGSYTFYARDTLENVSEQKIAINVFPEEGTAEINEGNIIKSINVSSNWSGNTNKEVIIILNNNFKIDDWEITDVDEMPEKFRPNQEDDEEEQEENTVQNNTASEFARSMNGNTNITITLELNANTQYYLWVKDMAGNVEAQGFSIKK